MVSKGNKNLDKLNITEHKYSLFCTKNTTKMLFYFKTLLNYLYKNYKIIE